MKFGPVAPGDAEGGIVVHSIRRGGLVLKKGSVVGDADIAALEAAGIKAIMVARIEPGDVSEDTAAADLAAAPLVRVAPYRIRKVGVISTVLPGLADKVIEKTLRVTQERLAPAGAKIVAERRVPHETAPLARALDEVLAAGAELAIVFGA